LAVQHGLDVPSIPNDEAVELFNNLNDLIRTAREREENPGIIQQPFCIITKDVNHPEHLMVNVL